jgi:hypothetical protein
LHSGFLEKRVYLGLKTMKSMSVKGILLMIAMGVGVTSFAQQSGRDLDNIVLATDNVTITVDTVNQTTKTPTTPFVDVTYEGGPLSIALYDEQGSFQEGDWSLIAKDPVVASLDPNIFANFFYTTGFITDDMAGQDYNITVRVNSETNGPNGVVQTINDEFDYYRNDITITYSLGGQTYTSTFRSPNSVTDSIFDFPEPFPFHDSYTLDNVNNPIEFPEAMARLGTFFDGDNNLPDVKVDQRNANNSNWADDELLYQILSQNAGTTTEPYPTILEVEMIDYTKKSAPVTPNGSPLEHKDSDDLTFDPPLGDDQVIDTTSVFDHTYLVTTPADSIYPELQIEGLSDNLQVDSIYMEQLEPTLYRVDLTLRAGPDVTEEDFQVNFVAQTVGTNELKLEDMALKYGPNPFSNDINLSYKLDDSYDMQIDVIGANGQVGSFDLGTQGQGEHNFKWSPDGNIADGMYMLRLVGTNSEGQQFSRVIKTIYNGK